MILGPKILLGRLWHCWLRFTGRRVIYIDCGANVGTVLEEKVRKYPSSEYFAFEANPDLIDQILAVKRKYPKTAIEVYNKAVWTEDSNVDFFLSRENSRGEAVTDGSTLLSGKVPINPGSGRIDYDQPVQVESVDFSKWILHNFRPQDYICLKMDIEGAEYAVLGKMLEDDSIRYINKAYVEFHYTDSGQLNSISKDTHEDIRSRVGKATKLLVWH